MNEQQKLFLFLISSNHSLWGVYNLLRAFDRMDFPAKITENINPLIENDFIRVHTLFENGTESSYIATEKGKDYVSSNIDVETIRNYVLTFDDNSMILTFIDYNLTRPNGT